MVSINTGEKVVETLKEFCKDNNIKLGTISGIGAVKKATIGFYNLETKKYYPKELNGDYEITSLLGNISTMNGEVYLHLHVNNHQWCRRICNRRDRGRSRKRI